MDINSNTFSLNVITASRKPDALLTTKSEAVSTTNKVAKTQQSFQQITSKYDVMNISPKEIDQLAFELRESDQADVKDIKRF